MLVRPAFVLLQSFPHPLEELAQGLPLFLKPLLPMESIPQGLGEILQPSLVDGEIYQPMDGGDEIQHEECKEGPGDDAGGRQRDGKNP